MTERLVAPIRVPDHFTVWAGSDLHGQLHAVDRLLGAAGLTDGADRWIAPPETALVVTGDVVDRGPDSLGLVRRLASLRAQAVDAAASWRSCGATTRRRSSAGSAASRRSSAPSWRSAVGRPCSPPGSGRMSGRAGRRPRSRRAWTSWRPTSGRRSGRSRRTRAGGTCCSSTAARCRTRPLERFERSADRLWIRGAFFASPDLFPDARRHGRRTAEAGFGRVVFGHTPVDEPTLCHAGRALNLDTWRGRQVTLARLLPGTRAGRGHLPVRARRAARHRRRAGDGRGDRALRRGAPRDRRRMGGRSTGSGAQPARLTTARHGWTTPEPNIRVSRSSGPIGSSSGGRNGLPVPRTTVRRGLERRGWSRRRWPGRRARRAGPPGRAPRPGAARDPAAAPG